MKKEILLKLANVIYKLSQNDNIEELEEINNLLNEILNEQDASDADILANVIGLQGDVKPEDTGRGGIGSEPFFGRSGPLE